MSGFKDLEELGVELSCADDINFSQKRLQAAGRGRHGHGRLLLQYQPSIDDDGCDLCGDKTSDLAHFLLPRCPKLKDRRDALLNYWRSVTRKHSTVSNIVETIIDSGDEELFLQLVLDCASVPEVQEAAADDPTVLPLLQKITNIWSYSLFRARLKQLGRWMS